ncbi:Sucrose phosphorylase [Rubellimicrobium mesophilum DSM 19309]|uniref:Sucrose phosphorylase n=1 Tax=Rubellimicrobium mesophilum DSM 19309 TaxID=442562 RepID=A0A017HLI8_9RHOB|nr:amylosucrase [Rubellimicrobium mesophilum]EYD75018.1 Sucrose phosphorylase [Rubellimicrobium mesophilum DSM 19309]
MTTTTAQTATPDPFFDLRWRRALRDLKGPLARLYPDAHDLLARLRALAERHSAERPADLRALDLARDLDPDWFLSQGMVAYVCYADRFAGTLSGIPERIPYLRDLGVTYLHLMPCLMPRPGQSDGGYAVMDYRRIDPRLGTMDDLESTAKALREQGISLCLDLVLNHTAKEHEWAERARAGDPHFQAFYRMFDDDRLPREYEKTLIDIFPDQAPGSFTYYPDLNKWVWTTFNDYQWDLNWENPEVLLAMLDIILHLANKGVEVFRLDAVAFMWKRMGTTCQNLPEVHDLLQVLVQATRAAAPGVIHKAEAIVGPKDLVPYLGSGRHEGRVSHLAYHNNLMVQFWSSLAARDTRLMTHVLRTHFPESFRRASFATYLRCHDDIGWAITPEDAAQVPHLEAHAHRQFLADFYNGTFPGAFARGADFQSNPETGDRRTNGSLASLCGLESALETGDAAQVEQAIARILMGHALIASFGGMPLLYMGDEIGLLNDPSYEQDPDLRDDGRWMQRPRMDWDLAARAELEPGLPAAIIHRGVKLIMAARKRLDAFAGHVPTRVLDTGHPRLFAYLRDDEGSPVTCLVNFTEHEERIAAWALRLDGPQEDALHGHPLQWEGDTLVVPPYGALWLRRAG